MTSFFWQLMRNNVGANLFLIICGHKSLEFFGEVLATF